MAQSNYRVLTDVDLSNNKLYNTLCIANTEKDSESLLADPDGGDKPLIQTSGDSKSLLIRTDGDTVLAASNLTGKIVNGKTSLKTGTSEVVVTGTAKETITASKTTTVATNTTETIDSTGIVIKTPSQTVVASGKSETVSPSVTLATGPLDPNDRSERASIALTKVADINKGPKVAISAKTIAVDATDTITQTAPTSTYRADEGDVNSLKLTTDDVKLKSDNEAITLTKAKDGAAAKTEIHSNNLIVNATTVEVKENTTTSIKASNSVSVGVGSKDNPSTTLNATTDNVALSSKEISLTTNVTKDGEAKSSSITLSPGGTESHLALNTDGKLVVNSASGVMIDDDNSVVLTAPDITETASNSASIYSGKISLQNEEGNTATESIALDHDSSRISVTARSSVGKAGVDVVGSDRTVTVTGAEFKVSSSKSTFAENSEFKKNVKVEGDLTTLNMSGEAAKLNSLDVKATTTVTGSLETGAATFSDVTATGATVTGSLEAEKGMTAKGPVSINGVDESGKSLTVTKTASTEKLIVGGELKTENGGVTSAGSVSILNNDSVPTSLTVNNTAEVNNLSVPAGTLTASNGMTSRGAVTVGGTTSVGAITGTGSLDIPGTAILKATSGGTTGRVGVTETTIHTIKGDGFLEIPTGSKLTVATNSDNDSGSIAVTSIEITTIKGGGSLEIPPGSKLTINNGGTSGTSTTGTFEPIDITVNKIEGAGNLEIPGGKTLTASNGGTIHGSMTIGESNSEDTNLILHGNATIGDAGVTGTTLTSNAAIQANSTLTVEKTATFNSEAKFTNGAAVKTLDLDGVTIKWDSTLGALTFSKG